MFYFESLILLDCYVMHTIIHNTTQCQQLNTDDTWVEWWYIRCTACL